MKTEPRLRRLGETPPAHDNDAIIQQHNDNKADSTHHRILSSMSLAASIGQMAQIDVGMLVTTNETTKKKSLNLDAVEEWIGQKGVGSVLNLVDDNWTAQQYRQMVAELQKVAHKHNRPPVIYGLDSVHGANYLHGAIVSPQPLNLAATFNETVAYEAGRLASRDTRAAGITWLFSPLLGIALSPRWSRVYETFGEDPLLVGQMATAMIQGIQDPDPDPEAIPRQAAACGKHFVGYSFPHNGHDRSPSWIPTRHLYQYFVPPWKRAIERARVKTIMEDYTETDGVPNVANSAALNYLLRQRLGFEGVLVTDYQEIRNLNGWHHTVPDDAQADQTSLRQGSVDMSMIPWDFDGFYNNVMKGIQTHQLSEERITISAERVLKLKQDLGMMDHDGLLSDDDPNLALVGTDEESVMDMVRQSIVLTKNENDLLPLQGVSSQKRLKVLVTGPTANSRTYQSGGWTGHWQGNNLENENDWFTYGSSVLGAFSAESFWDVSYRCGVDVLGNNCEDTDSSGDSFWDEAVDQVKDWVGLDDNGPESIHHAVVAASSADIVVIGVGEETYAEKPGDIRSLDLPDGQYSLVRSIKKNTKAKIILIYFGGRPRLLHDMVDHADAVFVGFLPGPSAGQAIAEMIIGRVNPSGRLPITYPLYDDDGGIPYFHTVSDQCTTGEGVLPHWDYVQCPVQWPFGHGLSYTTFEYSDFRASGGIDKDMAIYVTVKNVGHMAGAEVVMFFTFDDFRATTPEYKRLRAFEKVYLEPGSERRISKTVPAEDFRFIGPFDDTHYILDSEMTTWVGVGTSTDCRLSPDENILCVHLQSDNPSREYIAACEAACGLWTTSGCAQDFGLSNEECFDLCSSNPSFPLVAVDEANEGWGWNYVECLENVLQGMQNGEKECDRMTTFCRDIFSNTRTANVHPSAIPTENFAALLVGLVAASVVVVMMKGRSFGLSSGVSPETEFTAVNTQDDE